MFANLTAYTQIEDLCDRFAQPSQIEDLCVLHKPKVCVQAYTNLRLVSQQRGRAHILSRLHTEGVLGVSRASSCRAVSLHTKGVWDK